MIQSGISEVEGDVVSPLQKDDDTVQEGNLRPVSFTDYVGQSAVKTALMIALKAAQQRKESLEPVLFFGPPGLGKTTLAGVVAHALGSNLKVVAGPTLQRAGDLAAILTSLETGDVLFIDEIHRLPKVVEEILYPAMEDGVLDILVGKGEGARSVRVALAPITIVGATTRPALLSGPLRDRFGHQYQLEFYSIEELTDILRRSANVLNIAIEEDAARLLASRSRFTPRIANRLLRRARDFAQVSGVDIINMPVVEETLKMLAIDALGLNSLDVRLLEILIVQFQGGPAGMEAIAASLGEDVETLASVHEPFLLSQGLLVRTPRGRKVTEAALKHLGK